MEAESKLLLELEEDVCTFLPVHMDSAVDRHFEPDTQQSGRDWVMKSKGALHHW